MTAVILDLRENIWVYGVQSGCSERASLTPSNGAANGIVDLNPRPA